MGESKRGRARERDLISRDIFNFDRMRGPDNLDFKKIILSITAISSIDHKMKFFLIVDRSIDARRLDR